LLPAGAWWLAGLLGEEPGWRSLFGALDRPAPLLAAALPAAAALAALGMTVTGWLGRVGALGLIALASLDAVRLGAPSNVHFALLAASAGVLLLGAGRGALWGVEDALLERRAGERRA